MTLKLMGKKRGMLQMFDDTGHALVCTVIEVEPNVVTLVRTKEKDGYNALQISYDRIQVKDERTLVKRVKKPQLEEFRKIGVEPRRHRKECRVDNPEQYSVGQELGLDLFSEFKFIDVTGTSIGKGYQGVMKKYGFSGGPAAHGSGFHRHAGSTGMRSTPGRCFKGSPRPSHMGARTVTVSNLRVVRVDVENNLIIVEGQVPGPKNGKVILRQADKKEKV